MSKKSKFSHIAISLIGAIILFCTLLGVEAKILAPNGKAKVLIAKSDIDENTVITSKNIDKLFKEKEVDGELEVTKSVKDKKDLINTVTTKEINKNEVISKNSFIDKDNLLAKIENPVETSIKVSDLSQVVGGILREGDIIDISVINSTSGESKVVLENVYVDKAIASDGTEIDREKNAVATVLNIIISKEEEEILNTEIDKGTVRIRKIK